jgi:putative ATP-dependent endonuclease of the OLD family
MYLALDRLAYQQVKPTQWTVYGKLLKEISNTISVQQKTDFIADINATFATNILPHVNPVELQLKSFVKEQTGLDLSLKLSLIDPSLILKDLRPRITDNGFEVDVEEEGAGVQSAVGIAIARVYAAVVGMPLILAIEEPELYLHPHACRHFYKILKHLASNNIQIFYTTHERSFVNVSDFKNINVVKKEGGETVVSYFTGTVNNFDEIKAISKFDEEVNEVFFASKVILVEGPDDKIALRQAFEVLSVDLDKHNISVIDCGGVTAIKPLAEILNHFAIETFAVVDEDPGNAITAARIVDLKTVIPPAKVFSQSPDLEGLFAQPHKFSKETALRIIPVFYQSNAVQQIYQNLRVALNLA